MGRGIKKNANTRSIIISKKVFWIMDKTLNKVLEKNGNLNLSAI